MAAETKVFCIGFNKTATTSLHALFRSFGLTSFHGQYSKWPMTDERFNDFQCFSDGEQHDFKGLDKQFSGSKFILNSRGLEDWLVSRIQHTETRRATNQAGLMREHYERDPKSAVQEWIATRRQYYDDVFDYFSDKPASLLKVNIFTADDPAGCIQGIASFIGMPEASAETFPHRNSAESWKEKMSLSYRIKSFLRPSLRRRSADEIRVEVHAALQDAGLPENEWSQDGLRGNQNQDR